MSINVLFTCAGRRNYLAGYFRAAREGVRIVGADMVPHAPALQECDVGWLVPSVFAPDYVEAIARVCEAESIDVLISLNDHELPVLSRGRERIERTGARLLISAPEVIDLCFDKLRTAEWLAGLGIGTPRTFTDLAEVHAALDADTLSLPLVVKPRWGSASTATFSVHSRAELDHAYALVTADVLRGSAAAHSGAEVAEDQRVIVQQRLGGTEYGVDVLNDLHGAPCSVYVKEKIAMRSGETDRACLRDEPRLLACAQRIGAALGHIGNLDGDFFLDGDAVAVLELNPRFGGGYPFSHTAGADYPAAILAWLDGEPFDTAGFARRYDAVFAKADGLVATSGVPLRRLDEHG